MKMTKKMQKEEADRAEQERREASQYHEENEVPTIGEVADTGPFVGQADRKIRMTPKSKRVEGND